MSKILTICPEELSDDKAYSYGGRAVEKNIFIEFYKKKQGVENTPSEEELIDFSLKNSFSNIKGMVPVKISENKMERDFFLDYLENYESKRKILENSIAAKSVIEFLFSKKEEIEKLNGSITNKKFEEKMNEILKNEFINFGNRSFFVSPFKLYNREVFIYAYNGKDKFDSKKIYCDLLLLKEEIEKDSKICEEFIDLDFFRKEMENLNKEIFPKLKEIRSALKGKWYKNIFIKMIESYEEE